MFITMYVCQPVWDVPGQSVVIRDITRLLDSHILENVSISIIDYLVKLTLYTGSCFSTPAIIFT
jgi:hypothetical protein